MLELCSTETQILDHYKHRTTWLGYELDNGSSISDNGRILFSPPPRPDRLWDPPNVLSNELRGLFFLGSKAAGAWTRQLTSI